MVKNINEVKKGGFALISTISLLSLLILIVIAILSLSVIEQRSASTGSKLDEAKANARVAMMQALAELQKNAGPDTRVTASADAVAGGDEAARNLTGVWRSWEGLNHDATHGLPHAHVAGTITPIYDLKSQTGAHDNAGNNGRFLSWLVSSYDPTSDSAISPVDLSATGDTVPMLSTGSIRPDSNNAGLGVDSEVHVVPTNITEGTQQLGRYAWWVTGNNSKAYTRNKKAEAAADEEEEWLIEQRSASSVADAGEFGFSLTAATDGELPKMHSRDSFSLASTNGVVDFKNYFFDMTHTANGLLTNTANGGWRRDLSLFTDYIYDVSRSSNTWNESQVNQSNSNVFSLEPGVVRQSDTLYQISSSSGSSANDSSNFDGCIYPWWNIATGSLKHYFLQAGVSWHGIAEYANQYRSLTSSGNSPTFEVDKYFQNQVDPIGGAKGTAYSGGKTQNTARRYPVMSRIDWIFSTNTEQNSSGTYDLYLKVQPVVVIWNPYNVAIDFDLSDIDALSSSSYGGKPTMGFSWNDTNFKGYFPFDLIVEVGDQEPIVYDLDTVISSNNKPRLALDIAGVTNTVLRPGENKVFGTLASTSINTGGENVLEPDFDSSATFAWSFNLMSKNGSLLTGGSSSLTAGVGTEAVKMSIRYRDYVHGVTNLDDAITTTYYWNPYGGHKGTPADLAMIKNEYELTYKAAFETFPLPIDSVGVNAGYLPFPANETLVSLSGGDVFDFLLLTMGQRTIKQSTAANVNYVRSKGYYANHLSKPHPAHRGSYSNLDLHMGWNLSALAGNGSPEMLEVDAGVASGNDSAFMVTSNSSSGVSRFALAQLPVKPLSSLAELTHMDMAPGTFFGPHMSDAFGNSSASCLVDKEGVFVGYGRYLDSNLTEYIDGSGGTKITSIDDVKAQSGDVDTTGRYFYGLDHSYCSNHLLFDDWFVSSITNETDGISATVDRTADDVYRDHLEGNQPLVNEHYKPLGQRTTAEINTEVAGLSAQDAYLNIASDLQVEGMFNINSTSYKAWAAMLQSLRGVSQLEADYTGANSWSLVPEGIDTDELAYNRTTSIVRYDGAATSANNLLISGSPITDEMIYDDNDTPNDLSDDTGLAVEIVKQIKLRGPFLSLSEFVNRQLSDDVDLALSGAIESALHELSDDVADKNPFHDLQQAFPEQATTRTTASGAIFPEAAEGYAVYGYPGWIRQADILKTIAPIITARDDSFTIRAYGSSINVGGEEVKVWCEAVVERSADYVDPQDDKTEFQNLQSINSKYGRKFVIKSFRWLCEDEV